MIKFFKESYKELKLVTWPTKQELTRFFAIVVGLSVIVGLFVAGADLVYTKGLEFIVQ